MADVEALDFETLVTEPVPEPPIVPNPDAWKDETQKFPPLFSRPDKPTPSKTGLFSRSKQKELKEKTIADRLIDDPVPNRQGQFVKPLTELYGTVGMMIMPFDATCAKAVIDGAKGCAEALDQLAHENETVRRWLKGLLTTNALVAVVVAHAPILMMIAMHHLPFFKKEENVDSAAGNMFQFMREEFSK